MIRNVVVHISNEQPLMVDLVAPPSAVDACLVCSNLRTMNGKKPVFIDSAESTFLIPLSHVRFVEIPRESMEPADAEPAVESPVETKPAPRPIRRIAARSAASPAREPEPVAAGHEPEESGFSLASIQGVGESDPFAEGRALLERLAADAQAESNGLDGDLLRRIREA